MALTGRGRRAHGDGVRRIRRCVRTAATGVGPDPVSVAGEVFSMWLTCVRSAGAVAVAALLGLGAAPPAAALPDSLAMGDWVGAIAVSGEPFPVEFGNIGGASLPTGTLYVGNDTKPGFAAVPLTAGRSAWGPPALVAQVPAAQVRGQHLRYYAVFRDPATGDTATVPAGGPAKPGLVWVVSQPIEVNLGAHPFGQLTAPAAVVARVGADGVGWEEPQGDGVRYGPWSFEVGADGTVWLLDELNKRLLGWERGIPDRPTRVVPLPIFAADFAIGPNGTFYLTGEGELPGWTATAYSITATGTIRWRAPAAIPIFNTQLRVGPDGTLYAVEPGTWTWIPVTTPAGAPLSVAEQQRLTRKHQPLPGGGQLVVTHPTKRDTRAAIIDASGRPVRSWRITATTDVGPADSALPALAAGDPVVPLSVDAPENNGSPSQPDRLVLRLTSAGAPARLHLEHVIWGNDPPLTEYRVGPDGAFYQLRTSRTAGVKILRYSLDVAAPPVPTPTGGAVAPQPPTTAAPEPPGVAQPPAATTSPWTWLAWAGGITFAAVIIAGVLLWRRRRPPATPVPPAGPPVPDDTVDLTTTSAHRP